MYGIGVVIVFFFIIGVIEAIFGYLTDKLGGFFQGIAVLALIGLLIFLFSKYTKIMLIILGIIALIIGWLVYQTLQEEKIKEYMYLYLPRVCEQICGGTVDEFFDAIQNMPDDEGERIERKTREYLLSDKKELFRALHRVTEQGKMRCITTDNESDPRPFFLLEDNISDIKEILKKTVDKMCMGTDIEISKDAENEGGSYDRIFKNYPNFSSKILQTLAVDGGILQISLPEIKSEHICEYLFKSKEQIDNPTNSLPVQVFEID